MTHHNQAGTLAHRVAARAVPALSAALLLLGAGDGSAQAVASTGAAAASAPQDAAAAAELRPKMAPLLAFVLNQVSGAAFTAVTGDTPMGLFRRQLEKLRAQGEAPGGDAALPAGAGAAGRPERVVPVVGYAIEQLDPATFQPLRQLDVARPPVLRTHDVFALQYSTSLPGQVRLENVDPAGELHDLGVYSVAPDQLNRLPRTQGIKLVGRAGVEQIRLYFYPCLPAGFEGAPWVERFRGRLPACGQGQSPLLMAAAKGTLKTKALVNLSQPDQKTSFAGIEDYQPNEVTLAVAHIRHEEP